MARTGRVSAEVLEREQRVVQLRTAGATWAQIALQLGFKDPSGAFRAWQRAVSRIPAPMVAEYRRVNLERLEALVLSLWPKVQDGNPRAAEVVIRAIEREAKLLGLDAPEVKTVEVVTKDAVARAIEDLERQISELGGELPADL